MENSQIALSTLDAGFRGPGARHAGACSALCSTRCRGRARSAWSRTCCPKCGPRAPTSPRSRRCSHCATTPRRCGSRNPIRRLGSALRFHTGAPLVDEPGQAAFAYIHDAGALPPLESFALGEAESPEQSVTLLIRVEALTGGAPVVLSGPGIQHTATIAPRGTARAFLARTRRPRAALSLRCRLLSRLRRALIGLPRTTQAKVN